MASNPKRPSGWADQFYEPDEDEAASGTGSPEPEGEDEDQPDDGRPVLPPVDGKFESLDDVLVYNRKVLEWLADGKITGKQIANYSRLAQIVIQSRKTMATAGALSGGDAVPDLTEIETKPDLEARRPMMVQVSDFRSMTADQRREFFEGLQALRGRSGNGNGNGHAPVEAPPDDLLDL
jgi:hypothetical protein